MKPGDIVGPLTLENDNVLWVVLDPCQGATFARLVLEGIGNVDELMLFADLNGFPTGNPELDDFLPIANTEVTGANGRATFEISTLLPAPARLTGKPVFIGIINQFIDATNQFTLDFQSDGDCTISGPPPILSPDTPSVGDVEPDPNGGSSTNFMSAQSARKKMAAQNISLRVGRIGLLTSSLTSAPSSPAPSEAARTDVSSASTRGSLRG